MRSLGLVAALSTMLLCADASAELDEQSRFELFAECRPMRVAVGDLSFYAGEIGLDWGELEQSVLRRLEGVRLLDSSSDFGLIALVSVEEMAFHVRIAFAKLVRDTLGNEGFSVTWETDVLGTHGANGRFVMSAVHREIGKFLSEYVRVNEGWCG